MKSYILPFLLFLTMACTPEAETKVNWYKGNLHTHSYWSDGDDYPEMIMDWYRSNGYHFVGLSDHNTLQEGERWMQVPLSPIMESAFSQYLDRFGEDWVEWKEDTGRIQVRLKTLEEYRSLFEIEEEFLILQSEEITDGFEGKPIHINATNLRELIVPSGGNSVVEVMQRNIDQVLDQREQTGQPMFPHINHPNFGYAISPEDMMQLEGERFFEVYNGHPAVHNEGDSLRPDTETMWDMINVHYLRNQKPLIYGLATDDSHNYHTFGPEYSNTGRGWVMVRSESLDPASLIRSMEQGDFYATTGIILDKYEVDESGISLSVLPEEGIDYRILVIGLRKGDPQTQILKDLSGTQVSYTFQETDEFVRVKITSDKLKQNPYREGEYERCWTQPVAVYQ